MPRKDPVARNEYQEKWRKQAISNGYGKWIWQKRKNRQTDALEFRHALTQITQSKDADACRRIARRALKDSDKRWSGLGPPATHVPGAKTVFDVSQPHDDSLMDAMTKLGLPQ